MSNQPYKRRCAPQLQHDTVYVGATNRKAAFAWSCMRNKATFSWLCSEALWPKVGWFRGCRNLKCAGYLLHARPYAL